MQRRNDLRRPVEPRNQPGGREQGGGDHDATQRHRHVHDAEHARRVALGTLHDEPISAGVAHRIKELRGQHEHCGEPELLGPKNPREYHISHQRRGLCDH